MQNPRNVQQQQQQQQQRQGGGQRPIQQGGGGGRQAPQPSGASSSGHLVPSNGGRAGAVVVAGGQAPGPMVRARKRAEGPELKIPSNVSYDECYALEGNLHRTYGGKNKVGIDLYAMVIHVKESPDRHKTPVRGQPSVNDQLVVMMGSLAEIGEHMAGADPSTRVLGVQRYKGPRHAVKIGSKFSNGYLWDNMAKPPIDKKRGKKADPYRTEADLLVPFSVSLLPYRNYLMSGRVSDGLVPGDVIQVIGVSASTSPGRDATSEWATWSNFVSTVKLHTYSPRFMINEMERNNVVTRWFWAPGRSTNEVVPGMAFASTDVLVLHIRGSIPEGKRRADPRAGFGGGSDDDDEGSQDAEAEQEEGEHVQPEGEAEPTSYIDPSGTVRESQLVDGGNGNDEDDGRRPDDPLMSLPEPSATCTVDPVSGWYMDVRPCLGKNERGLVDADKPIFVIRKIDQQSKAETLHLGTRFLVRVAQRAGYGSPVIHGVVSVSYSGEQLALALCVTDPGMAASILECYLSMMDYVCLGANDYERTGERPENRGLGGVIHNDRHPFASEVDGAEPADTWTVNPNEIDRLGQVMDKAARAYAQNPQQQQQQHGFGGGGNMGAPNARAQQHQQQHPIGSVHVEVQGEDDGYHPDENSADENHFHGDDEYAYDTRVHVSESSRADDPHRQQQQQQQQQAMSRVDQYNGGGDNENEEEEDDEPMVSVVDPFAKRANTGAAAGAFDRGGAPLFGYALWGKVLITDTEQFYARVGLPITHEMAFAVMKDVTWRHPPEQNAPEYVMRVQERILASRGVTCINEVLNVEAVASNYTSGTALAEEQRENSRCYVVLHHPGFDREFEAAYAAITPEEGDIILAMAIWEFTPNTVKTIQTSVNKRAGAGGRAPPPPAAPRYENTDTTSVRIRSPSVDALIMERLEALGCLVPAGKNLPGVRKIAKGKALYDTPGFANLTNLLQTRRAEISREHGGAVFLITDPGNRNANERFTCNALFRGRQRARVPPPPPDLALPVVSTSPDFVPAQQNPVTPAPTPALSPSPVFSNGAPPPKEEGAEGKQQADAMVEEGTKEDEELARKRKREAEPDVGLFPIVDDGNDEYDEPEGPCPVD